MSPWHPTIWDANFIQFKWRQLIINNPKHHEWFNLKQKGSVNFDPTLPGRSLFFHRFTSSTHQPTHWMRWFYDIQIFSVPLLIHSYWGTTVSQSTVCANDYQQYAYRFEYSHLKSCPCSPIDSYRPWFERRNHDQCGLSSTYSIHPCIIVAIWITSCYEQLVTLIRLLLFEVSWTVALVIVTWSSLFKTLSCNRKYNCCQKTSSLLPQNQSRLILVYFDPIGHWNVRWLPRMYPRTKWL